MTTSRWFWRWLKRHKRLCPHSKWAEYEGATDEERAQTYAGWIAAFQEYGVTEEQADMASEQLQLRHPGYPEHHLAAVMDLIAHWQTEDRRARDRAERARRRAAAEALRDLRAAQAATWDELDQEERARCLAEALAEAPALAPWPALLLPIAYDAMDRRRNVVRFRRGA